MEANNLQEGVNPAEEHRQRVPDCPLLLGMPIGNESADSGDDLVGRTDGIQILPSSGPEMYVNKEASLEKFGVYHTKGPIYSEYATYAARLATYASWPLSLRQRPDKLSDAGFFYTGFGDQTVCFHCGGGLVDWEDNEDPWEEHAMWLSECGYLLLVKGKEFIQEAVSKKNTVLEAQDTSEHMDCDEIPPAVAESSSSSDVSESIPGPSSVDTPSQSSQRATNEFKGTLVDENKKTEDALLCKICYKNNMGVLFLPCGHLMSCTRCAPSLALCAFCRQPITGIIRAYLP